MEKDKPTQRKRVASSIKRRSESINKTEQGKYRTYDFSSSTLVPKKIFTKKSNGVSYECISKSGTGSFGVVFKAKIRHSGKLVAIKRVLQDMRYKNRELEIMSMVSHTNVVKLIDNFYEKTSDGIYLNLVLEFVPRDLYAFCNSARYKSIFSMFHVKLFMYQILRSLSYIHSLGICHRDIKPQNILVDPETYQVKLCDFGSAKILVPGEPNVSYICSRYYRAPELIIGATEYTPAIDLWSTGCVMGELLLGKPLFAAENGVDQLVEIIKILGTPSYEEMKLMNPSYKKLEFPQIPSTPWEKVFPSKTPASAIDLIGKLLIYIPSKRIDPLEACAHPFFDELRESNGKLINGKSLPKLFDFTKEEIEMAKSKGIYEKLLPKNHVKSTKNNITNDKL